jgi:signal peptidase II
MTSSAPSPARERALARARALLVIAAAVTLDQGTKIAARALLEPNRRVSFLGDVFRLELVQNPGAFLSLGATLPPRIRGLVLTWGVLALVLGAAWVAVARPGARHVSLGAALVAGGGLGNLWDRIAANGYVTDFLNLGLGRLRTGVFNVADLAIVGGAVILLWPTRAAPPAEPPPPDA